MSAALPSLMPLLIELSQAMKVEKVGMQFKATIVLAGHAVPNPGWGKTDEAARAKASAAFLRAYANKLEEAAR